MYVNTITGSNSTGGIKMRYITASFITASGGFFGTSSWSEKSTTLFGTSNAVALSYLLTGSYYNYVTSSYTLQNSDNGRLIIGNSGSSMTITVSSTLPQGFACNMLQSGSGKIIVAGSGVSIINGHGLSASFGQYSVINLLQTIDTQYVLQGDVG